MNITEPVYASLPCGYERPAMRVKSVFLRNMLLNTSFSAGSLTQDDSSSDFFGTDDPDGD